MTKLLDIFPSDCLEDVFATQTGLGRNKRKLFGPKLSLIEKTHRLQLFNYSYSRISHVILTSDIRVNPMIRRPMEEFYQS